jgi:hypothetical protein
MTRISVFPILAAGAVAASCGASNNFVPENATSVVDGNAATSVAIPPEAPRGEVRIASSGLTTLRANDAPDLPAVHVRMEVSNDADHVAWTVDTREQLLAVQGGGTVQPAFANADIDGLPLVQVAPREKRTIDLYYAVPDDDVVEFELAWQVATGDRVVGERTAFYRTEPESGPTYATMWGPYWWYDPFYPRYQVYVSGRVHGHRHHGYVVRAPRRGGRG